MVKEDLGNLISQKEAAELRGVTLAAISDLINRGRLQSVEVGGRRYVRRTEVVSFKPGKGGRPTSSEAAARKAKTKAGTKATTQKKKRPKTTKRAEKKGQ
jgi:excisionase family DNA binding protein